MDTLADRMTSPDITRWMAYFQAIHELGVESAGLPISVPASPIDATPEAARRPGFQPLSEDALRAKFRAHNTRLGL